MMRMFTCCEKKLLTVLYNNSYKIEENALQVNLIITREPCKLCERAIEGIEKMFVVNVIYPSPKKSQLPILKFDNYAQSILILQLWIMKIFIRVKIFIFFLLLNIVMRSYV